MLANCQGGGPVTKTYPDPKIQGVRLDWCYKWGAECGAPAAKAFCVSKNLPLVKGFAKAENIGVYTKTKVFSSGQICAAPECDGFTYIKCGK